MSLQYIKQQAQIDQFAMIEQMMISQVYFTKTSVELMRECL